MTTPEFAWYLTLVVLALIALTFIVVILSSKARPNGDNSPPPGAYRLRKQLFAVAIIGGVAVTGLTLHDLPHAAHKSVGSEAVAVDVTGYQWRWEISRTTLPVNTPIVFNVTSDDVNHGFGIYNDKLKLLGQTQAMPDYVNKLVYTFTKPGDYRILCLEYCGVAHHSMTAILTVTDNLLGE